MALHWDVTKVDNFEEVLNKDNWPITNTVIWASMAVDMQGITDKNWREFYARIRLCEKLHGTYLKGEDMEPYPITPAHIKRLIGLKVNVAHKPRAAWLKSYMGSILEDGISATYRAEQETQEA